MRRVRDWISRLIRAMKIIARDERIPKPVRLLAGFALLPIPGPVDEVVLILIAPLFLGLYRPFFREAWAATAEPAG